MPPTSSFFALDVQFFLIFSENKDAYVYFKTSIELGVSSAMNKSDENTAIEFKTVYSYVRHLWAAVRGNQLKRGNRCLKSLIRIMMHHL